MFFWSLWLVSTLKASPWFAYDSPLTFPSVSSLHLLNKTALVVSNFIRPSNRKWTYKCPMLNCGGSVFYLQSDWKGISSNMPMYFNSAAWFLIQLFVSRLPTIWSKAQLLQRFYHNNAQKQLKIKIEDTYKTDLVATVSWERCQYLLCRNLHISDVCWCFLDKYRQECINSFLNVDILPSVE